MAKKVYIDFELRYKEAVKNLDEMQKEYTKLENSVEKYEKQTKKAEETSNELGGTLDKVTGGAVTKFKGLKTGLGGVTKSFKTLRGAIIATGIGALIVAIGSLTAMFSRSEEGQNKFAKILTQLGVIAGNVMDIFSDLGKVVFNVFTGNFKGAKEAINDVTEGIKNFGEETRREIKVAGELADKRAKADKVERKLLVERAEATRKFNELREKAADKENVSIEDRIAALKEAGRIEDEITKKEIEAARLRFEAKKQENALAESTKEDLDEQAQLEARLIELEASRLKKQKTLTAEITTNLREAKAERKAEQAEKDAEDKLAEDKEKARLDSIQKIRDDFKKKTEDEAAQTEVQKLELEKERKLTELKELEATEDQKAEIIAFYRKKIDDATDKANDEQDKKEELLAKQKEARLQQTVGNLISIVGANSKFGKGIAAANAIRDTFAGANKAFAQGGIFGFVQGAAIIASGLKNVKTIMGTKDPTPTGGISRGGGGSDPSISIPSSTVDSISPQFNVVGAAGTNQLADVIAGQSQQPTRAYVVSNDVSTAQELDRNIIEGASIG